MSDPIHVLPANSVTDVPDALTRDDRKGPPSSARIAELKAERDVLAARLAEAKELLRRIRDGASHSSGYNTREVLAAMDDARAFLAGREKP